MYIMNTGIHYTLYAHPVHTFTIWVRIEWVFRYIFTIYARVRPHIHIFLHSTYLFYFLCAILPFILYSSPCASLCVVRLLTYGSCGRGLPILFCMEREAESEAKLKTQQSTMNARTTYTILYLQNLLLRYYR